MGSLEVYLKNNFNINKLRKTKNLNQIKYNLIIVFNTGYEKNKSLLIIALVRSIIM